MPYLSGRGSNAEALLEELHMQYVQSVNTCPMSLRHALLAYCVVGVCVYWEGHIGACDYYLLGLKDTGVGA